MEIDDDIEFQRHANTRLWVDKYRPKKFTDLTGDERLNRECLKWLKQWDYCVFGRAHRQVKAQDGGNKDPLQRPEKRVLLLVGPPGSTKTTVAHAIARHCGYHIVEVNASDDRSGQVVQNKIRDILRWQSALNKKPNILIIDEVDGAIGGGEQSFIRLLVDIIKDDDTRRDKSKAGNKSKEKNRLRRPIICICNDQYVPSIRPLREIAQVYQFRKCQSAVISPQLQKICKLEGVSADLRTLSALVDAAEGDLRTCLNTLQFLSQKSKVITAEMVNRDSIGLRDVNQSLFHIWEEIFQLKSGQKKRIEGRIVTEEVAASREDKYLARLSSMINTNSEYDKLMQGCFENYPNMKFNDSNFSKRLDVCDWLVFYDQVNQRLNSRQQFGLQPYLPYSLAAFHPLFAGSVKQDIKYPRTDYQYFIKTKEREQAIASFLDESPKYLSAISKEKFATEYFPYVSKIIDRDAHQKADRLSKVINLEVPRKNILVSHTEREAPVDFFGRPIKRKAGAQAKRVKKEETRTVYFRFNEGFSNAPRQKMRVRDFL
ncbi:10923_t:CDS:10 [Paraglomus brasilianum]|uniref:10923_t:CDS:1 n=1 Tax=Paraglomus brasilianum TaxID=144538 RepID=A0A9N8WBH0_9GLOM|nr:10923_t:CDS:10 [Paraglomus brasilianum]